MLDVSVVDMDAGRAGFDGAVTPRKPSENSVAELDRRLREYARQRAALDAAEAFDLFRAEQLRVHVFYGCATFFEYLERRLGYAPHTARERTRVARALVGLPETSAALARGELTFSAVRELTRVATADTESFWLERARSKTVREVEELVAGHKPGDGPDDPADPDLRTRMLPLDLPPQAHALWREVRLKVAQDRGGELTDADVFETICRAYLNPGTGAQGPVHQIAYKQCKDCKRATQNGAGRELDVAPHVIERAACDATTLGSLDAASPERVTTSVTLRVRRQVFARDGLKCRVPGCRSARHLEVHHIDPQANGGGNELWNLLLLCGGHHDAHHAGLLSITGRAPHDVRFRWTLGAPMPPALTREEREIFIAQRVDEIVESWQRGPDEDTDIGEHSESPARATRETGGLRAIAAVPPAVPHGTNNTRGRPGKAPRHGPRRGYAKKRT